jgi:hypothetical protein
VKKTIGSPTAASASKPSSNPGGLDARTYVC